MSNHFMRCLDEVPGFSRTLVGQGVDPRTLGRLNREAQANVAANARGIVAEQLQVPAGRLPQPRDLQNQPCDTFEKVASAISSGTTEVLPGPVYRQLQQLLTFIHYPRNQLAPFAGPTLKCGLVCSLPDLSRLDRQTSGGPKRRAEQINALWERNRERRWQVAGHVRPQPNNVSEQHWLEEIEHFSVFPSLLNLSQSHVHLGMACASLLMDRLPQRFARSRLGSFCAASLANTFALLAGLAFMSVDAIEKGLFERRHGARKTQLSGQASARESLERAWPNVTNPFSQQPWFWQGDKADELFDEARREALQRCIHRHEHAAAPTQADRTVRVPQGPGEGPMLHVLQLVLPEVAPSTLDELTSLSLVDRYNQRVRPFVFTDRLLAKLAERAMKRPTSFWTASVAVMADRHKRNDTLVA